MDGNGGSWKAGLGSRKDWGGRRYENSGGVGVGRALEARHRGGVAHLMKEKQKMFLWVAWSVTCEVETKGRRTRSGLSSG